MAPWREQSRSETEVFDDAIGVLDAALRLRSCLAAGWVKTGLATPALRINRGIGGKLAPTRAAGYVAGVQDERP